MLKELPLQRISELFRYDEETGSLYWKINRGRRGKINTVAGNLNPSGYVHVRIDGILYKAHRVIYALAYLKSHILEIDHIDGDRSNNRLGNLREVSRSVNTQNTKARGTWKWQGRWKAQIMANYKKISLGSFDTEEEAHQAYLAAKKIYHPEAKRN
jgi:excinuclease UvrABC ATPase subunit